MTNSERVDTEMLFSPKEQQKVTVWQKLKRTIVQRLSAAKSSADSALIDLPRNLPPDILDGLESASPGEIQSELGKQMFIIEARVPTNQDQTEWIPIILRGFSLKDDGGNTVKQMLCYLYPNPDEPLANACHAFVLQVQKAGSPEIKFKIFHMIAAENGPSLRQRVGDAFNQTASWVSDRSPEPGTNSNMVIAKIDEQITNALRKHGEAPDLGDLSREEYKSRVAQGYQQMMEKIGLNVSPEEGAVGPKKMDSGVAKLMRGQEFSQAQIEAEMSNDWFDISGCTVPKRAGEMIQPVRIFGSNVDIGDGRTIRVMVRFEPTNKSMPSDAGTFILTKDQIIDGEAENIFEERRDTSMLNFQPVELSAWLKVMRMVEEIRHQKFVAE